MLGITGKGDISITNYYLYFVSFRWTWKRTEHTIVTSQQLLKMQDEAESQAKDLRKKITGELQNIFMYLSYNMYYCLAIT